MNKQESWENAAIAASNLSELELTLGEVAEAVGDAEQSVTYADRSGDGFQRMGKRTTHADALHQAGRRAEAETRFREAEQMQAERQPAYPLLYSVGGFRYCDLLLAAPERAAWLGSARALRVLVGAPAEQLSGESILPDSSPSSGQPAGAPVEAREGAWATQIASCRAVSQRVAQTLKWAEQNRGDILSAALDHLTLGRAALYEAFLSRSGGVPPPNEDERRQDAASPWATARRELDAAVAGLRRAGQQNYLPRALLTRAWLRFLTPSTSSTGSPQASSGQAPHGSAQEDLDEAWEIAERGPMTLFLADIHLQRARLFGNPKSEARNPKYPWASPQADLAEARRLIFKHGYLRRKEELADAEAVILGR